MGEDGRIRQLYLIGLALLLLISAIILDGTVAVLFGTHMAIGLILSFFVFRSKNLEDMLILGLLLPLLIPFVIHALARFFNFSTSIYIMGGIFIALILWGFKNKTWKHNLSFLKKTDSLRSAFIFLALFLFLYFIFSSLHAPNLNLPRTDTFPELLLEHTTIVNIQKFDKIFLWNEKALLGYPELFIANWGHVYMSAFFDYLYTLNPVFLFKYFFLFSVFILIYGIYIFGRRLTGKHIFPLLTGLTVLSTHWIFDIIAHGRLRSFTAGALIPFMLYYAFWFEEDNNHLKLPLVALMQFFMHPITAGMTFMVIEIFLVLKILLNLHKNKLLQKPDAKKIFKKTKQWIIFNLILLGSLAFWFLEFLNVRKYLDHTAYDNSITFSMMISAYLGSNLTSIMIILALISVIAVAMKIKEKKGIEFSLIYLALALFSLGYILPFISDIWSIFITARGKLQRFVMVFGTILILYLPELKIKKIPYKIFYYGTCILLIIFLAMNYGNVVETNEYVTDMGLMNANSYSTADVIKENLKPGRFATYGSYTLARDPIIQLYSDFPMISLGVRELSGIGVYLKIREDQIRGSFIRITNKTVESTITPIQLGNNLRLSAVQYIILNPCNYKTHSKYMRIVINKSNVTKIILEDEEACGIIYYVTNSSFADTPYPVLGPVYGDENANDWKKIYVDKDFKFRPIPYQELSYKRVSPDIILVNTKGLDPGTLVRVKEQYNPFWTVQSTKKELKLYRDNFGTMFTILEDYSSSIKLKLVHPMYIKIVNLIGLLIVIATIGYSGWQKKRKNI